MLENREGQRVPQVTFHVRRDGEWVDVTTDEIFAGRRVVLFALPGAYTPTCSSTHLPRYDELAPVFREHGVDEVVCLSVNDTFVMNQWQQDQGALDVTFLPDGSARFTDGMGMLVDKDDLGFGPRSWRYSMLVEDGVVKKMFIEPEEPGDPFQVSDADTMLRYLAPDAQPSGSIAIFTRRGCPHCTRAKELLVKEDLRFSEIVVGEDVTPRAFSAVTGASAVPQVFIGGKRIGGADDLERYLGA